MIRRLLLALAIAFALRPAYASAQSAPAPAPALISLPARPTMKPIGDCAGLVDKVTAHSGGISFRVVRAEIEPAVTGHAAFCRVLGYAAPQTQFELRLPLEGYTGRYLQGGCGGMCGVFSEEIVPLCSNAHAYGGAFALSFNNGGHFSAGIGDGTWAVGDPALREQFAFGAAHATAVASKAVIARFYGKAPARSYFVGCSGGGREGLMEAQRFPTDFDGIVAGSSVSMPAAMQRFIWEAQKGLTPDGREIFTPEAAALLHRAVIAACDGLDGITDGEIDDPRRCHFDPARLLCPQKAGSDCLSAEQVATAAAYYSGPVDETGGHLFPGGEPYGSELSWASPAAFTRTSKFAGEAFVRDILLPGELPPTFTWRDWRFNRADFDRLMKAGALYDAADPDLRPFRDAGGKLLMWQGAADNASGPYGMLDYYQGVRDRVGGLAAARAFVRLFLVPGGYHCRGGYIAYDEDFLGAMVAWVEEGKPADGIVATARLDNGSVRRRPLFAYPTQTHYRGGDINAATSFVPRPVTIEPADGYDWPASSALHRPIGARP